MTQHLFANLVTPFGTAANNRGETEGNTTTLHKIVWHGQPHTTVSAEAIRFALRTRLAQAEAAGTNRRWNPDTRANEWQDHTFKDKKQQPENGFIDDDLLGYMSAQAAKDDAAKGMADVRRSILELTRAVSLTPWTGDYVFNAASPGATPSASKGGGNNPVPYSAEVHATRYQYGLAMTPAALRDPGRAAVALTQLAQLGPVAGNQGRFRFDFSPDAIVLRVTDDPAPRLLYCFGPAGDDPMDLQHVTLRPDLIARVEAQDILADELILGGSIADRDEVRQLANLGATVLPGVKQAVAAAIERIDVEAGAHADGSSGASA